MIGKSSYANEMRFIYDANGICGIDHNSSQYFFRKNAQGDITHIYSIDGSLVAMYVYDAWGNHRVLNPDGTDNLVPYSIGHLNPFRYRGYYFDTVTGLYYLQTRYYDPETGRFISQDDFSYLAPETINGLNLYAYCSNNPILYKDGLGFKPQLIYGIEFWTLYSINGYVWYSGRYTPKRQYDYNVDIKSFWNNFLLGGEEILSLFDIKLLNYKLDVLSFSATGFTVISSGIDFLDFRLNVENEYIGIKLGSVRLDFLDFAWENELKLNILDAQASLLTVGAYTQYADVELLVGSIGATIGFENGALTIGLSYGWGIKITIRFW